MLLRTRNKNYEERAKGDTGLIITSLAKVENEIDSITPGLVPDVSQNPARFIQKGSELTERVHNFGSKIFLQLTLGVGRVGSPHMLQKDPVAPSEIPNYWGPDVTCRKLETEEVEKLVESTAKGAAIAKQAGFDGVEIHAVHEGYLLDQFTIDLFNNRTDKYGGDLEGRLRFPIEIVKAIKSTVGSDFPVQLRYSIKSFIKDWNQGGLPDEDFEEKGRDVEEGLKAAKILEEAGYDSFNADTGSYDAWYWAHPPNYQKNGCYLPYTEKLKEVIDSPVLVAGRMDDPELARNTIKENKAADMITIGRGLLADPSWPKKVKKNEENNIRPCIGCHDGCLGRGFEGKQLSCAVNPACGREEEYGIEPANEIKDVLVIGGGPAGMEAARVAAERGHNITLYEEKNELGGHLIEASVPEFKGEEMELRDWYKNQLDDLSVDVELGQKLTFEKINEEEYDTILVATGSEHIIPDIPGIGKDKVVTATDLLLNQNQDSDNYVVIGGGLVGCETALWLARMGKEVSVIEALDGLMKKGAPICHSNKEMLVDLLEQNGVQIRTNTKLSEVTDVGVVVSTDDGSEVMEAEKVVLAIGLKENSEIYESLRSELADIYELGDSKDPRRIMDAIWDGYGVAREI